MKVAGFSIWPMLSFYKKYIDKGCSHIMETTSHISLSNAPQPEMVSKNDGAIFSIPNKRPIL
jgi:hypothetical protein